MNTSTTFFRLLHVPIDAKGDALAERIAALNGSASLNAAGALKETYTLDPAAFAQIPGSPFAYWISSTLRTLFVKLIPFESADRNIRSGLKTADDYRFVRTWWEIDPKQTADHLSLKTSSCGWVPFAKGGVYSPFYSDVNLLVNWGRRQQIAATPWSDLGREEYYGRPGLTYPTRTTSGFSPRCLPLGCIFGHKGSSIFFTNDLASGLLSGLAIATSTTFRFLIKLGVGAAVAAARSYEVGLIKMMPWPAIDETRNESLAALAIGAHDLQRDRDRTDETTHAFCLPGLAARREAATLPEASAALDAEETARQSRLAAIQAQIDDIVFDLYGLSETDRALVRRETGSVQPEASAVDAEDEEADEEAVVPQGPITRVQDLLMWCVGAAFGRWDVRKALDPSLLPPLGGPFDPLPRHAPGALLVEGSGQQAEDLSPATAICALPSAIPPDGILVDDPAHPSDIVRRVREVLELLWGERAESVETEACEIIGVKSLREYFRDPRRFFAHHIKRYSKSRRKAPIYWLLQSERRNYGIWLYYHRITPMTLYIAGRDYADGKIALERGRLDDLRAGLDALSGTARRNREREIERQEKLVAEVTAFGKTLDKVALANLPPDPNDGVLISIAPLHPLVPWNEASRMWEALRSGQYSWSTMAKRL